MADQKITDLTADTTPTDDDLLVTVDDPAGTPTNKKVAVSDLSTKIQADLNSGGIDLGSVTDASTVGFVVDEDAMTGDSDTKVPTQQSVKAYADTKQPLDADLTAIAGLTSAADRLPYFTGSGTASLATFTSFGRSLVDDADAATARTTLGLVIGTNVQAQDAELAAIAGLTSAADKLPYFTGSGTAALADFTTAGRALVDDADASAQRTTLGLGTMATATATDYFLKAFGTTTQSVTNTAGRRINFENDNSFASNDIALRMYLNSTDTASCFFMQTVVGAVFAFSMGPGGSTAPDTVYGRLRAYVASTNVTSAATGKPFRVKLLSNVTAVGNITTGDDDLQTLSIPANLMASNGDLVICEWYGTGANNANAKTLRVKYGATTVLTVTLPTSVAVSWSARLLVTRTGATTQDCWADCTYNGATVGGFSTAAETLSGAVTAKCTGDATATNDVVSEIGHAYWEPTP